PGRRKDPDRQVSYPRIWQEGPNVNRRRARVAILRRPGPRGTSAVARAVPPAFAIAAALGRPSPARTMVSVRPPPGGTPVRPDPDHPVDRGRVLPLKIARLLAVAARVELPVTGGAVAPVGPVTAAGVRVRGSGNSQQRQRESRGGKPSSGLHRSLLERSWSSVPCSPRWMRPGER